MTSEGDPKCRRISRFTPISPTRRANSRKEQASATLTTMIKAVAVAAEVRVPAAAVEEAGAVVVIVLEDPSINKRARPL